MKQDFFIPDHSPAALDEAYQAALLNLAFKEMEQEEWAMLRERIQETSREPRRAQFAQKLRRRYHSGRAKALALHALPRFAQVAACLIAVLSIGAGVALAASQQARSWAAGILTGAEIEESGFTADGKPAAATITDGVSFDGRLLLVEDGTTLALRDATDAEPVRYEWKERDGRAIASLAADGNALYAVCEDEEDFFEESGPREYAIGRLTFTPDGGFTVDELARLSADELASSKPGACYQVEDAVAAGGRLYILGYADVSPDGYFGMSEFALYACELASGAVAKLELPAPEKPGSVIDDCRLFAGESAYLATTPREGQAAIYRIGADGSSEKLTEFPEGSHPNSFAYRGAANALYYQQGSAIYEAPNFDVANARRVALSGGRGGRGLLLGENSFAIVRFDGVCEVFDFEEAPAGAEELVVGGNLVPLMSDELRAALPNLTLVNDPMDNPAEYESEAEYREMLISGEAKADLVSSFCDTDGALYDVGWGKPITDEAICAEIDRMPEGVRAYVTRDGAYIGLPSDTFCAYSDVSISPAHWSELGLGELPETWLEFLQKLGELSHSPDAGKYPIYPSQEESGGIPPAQLLAQNMANSFARSWAARGMEPDFSGEDFRAAIEALRDIDFDALRFTENGGWGENSQPLLDLLGDAYDPMFLFDFKVDCTLKIRPEDEKISGGSCYIDRINPATDAEEHAYAYLRAQMLSDDQHVFERLRTDFATPAGELAEWSGGIVTAEEIETYRDEVGDVWLDEPSEEEQNSVVAALTAWFRGEADFEATSERLNAIYAG